MKAVSTNSPYKYVLLTLGEELLLGLTQNTHLDFIGHTLKENGANLHANLTISDFPTDIQQFFAYFWEVSDIMITTGGLGPTVDDRTKEIIAEVLGEELVFDDEVMRMIEERFSQIGRPMTENNRKQAYRLKQAEVIPNTNGTAPGLWLEKNGKILIMLPGPPHEMQPMFTQQVLPKLRERGKLKDKENYLQIRTAGVGESSLEEKLQPILRSYPNIDVAYCAHQGQVDFRLSLIDHNFGYDELIEIATKCRNMLGDDYICCGEDNLQTVVSNILRRKNLTLATAEGVTGGLLADAFSYVRGAVKLYKGGVTLLSDQAKRDALSVPNTMIQQHGSASLEVAIAMATAVAEKFESDYAISTTGFNDRSLNADRPASTSIYIGLHTPHGVWGKEIVVRGNQSAVRRRTLNASLDWLRRDLIENAMTIEEANADLRAESERIIKSFR